MTGDPDIRGNAAPINGDEAAMWSPSLSRGIDKRIVVEGTLKLIGPAHLGNGDGDRLTDMPLLHDRLQGLPLLTGTSIAGALRAYLARQLEGDPDKHGWVQALFGVDKGREEGAQSALIVDDAFGKARSVERRDGVALDPKSRTAAPNKLFNLEAWPAGTTFGLRFELLLTRSEDEQALRLALATALEGLSNGQITLGARKRRGYGRVEAGDWRVTEFDVRAPEGLLAWLAADLSADEARDWGAPHPAVQPGLRALGEPLALNKHSFDATLTLALEGGLLIRGNTGRDDVGPDLAQLQGVVLVNGNPQTRPIIPGTSLAGALRGRAMRIANTVLRDEQEAIQLVADMFGLMDDDALAKTASRVSVQEAELRNVTLEWVQNRVSIDRFTGGTLDTALFNEQPALPLEGAEVTVNVSLNRPERRHIALLLLTIKDLCCGDLPVGGTVSIGRGCLRGRGGHFELWTGRDKTTWTFEQDGDALRFTEGAPEALDQYVKDGLRATRQAEG